MTQEGSLRVKIHDWQDETWLGQQSIESTRDGCHNLLANVIKSTHPTILVKTNSPGHSPGSFLMYTLL